MVEENVLEQNAIFILQNSEDLICLCVVLLFPVHCCSNIERMANHKPLARHLTMQRVCEFGLHRRLGA